jgi:hypothetical protein
MIMEQNEILPKKYDDEEEENAVENLDMNFHFTTQEERDESCLILKFIFFFRLLL